MAVEARLGIDPGILPEGWRGFNLGDRVPNVYDERLSPTLAAVIAVSQVGSGEAIPEVVIRVVLEGKTEDDQLAIRQVIDLWHGMLNLGMPIGMPMDGRVSVSSLLAQTIAISYRDYSREESELRENICQELASLVVMGREARNLRAGGWLSE